MRAGITGYHGRRAPVPKVDGHVWVPIDDEHTWTWNWNVAYDETPFPPGFQAEWETFSGRGADDVIPGTFKLKANLANDYFIDRQKQKTQTFTGIRGLNTQDIALQEGMGPIVDRSREHLGSTDKRSSSYGSCLEAVDEVERGGRRRSNDPQTYRTLRPYDDFSRAARIGEPCSPGPDRAVVSRARAFGLRGTPAQTLIARPATAQTGTGGETGSGSVEANAQGFYAQDAGLFKRAGLTTEITILRSGPAIAAAVIGGDLRRRLKRDLAGQREAARDRFPAGARVGVRRATRPKGRGSTRWADPLGEGSERAHRRWAVTLFDRAAGHLSLGRQERRRRASVKYVEVPPSAWSKRSGRAHLAAALQDPDSPPPPAARASFGRAYGRCEDVYVECVVRDERLAREEPATARASPTR